MRKKGIILVIDMAYFNKKNGLKTRQELYETFIAMMHPVYEKLEKDGAKTTLGQTGTSYDEVCSSLEVVSRPLWALAFLANEQDERLDKIWNLYVDILADGTDEKSTAYWGRGIIHHQRYVEMAAISVALLLAPNKLWDKLDTIQKQNLMKWLGSVGEFDVPNNNWCFFVVFINLALKRYGGDFSAQQYREALENIEKCYLGDGWYSDGPTDQRDYYIPFAYHYYGLLYCYIMKNEDLERCTLYMERAKIFADDYIYWYGEDGSSLPFGRSLTYRFASTGFWALLVEMVKDFDVSIAKGIYLRSLRWWLTQPIFDADGILSIGYSYPNLVFAEGYNAPGSPYWAFKGFAGLLLPVNHPFWTADETPLPKLEFSRKLPNAYMLIQRHNGQPYAYTAGQHATWQLAHAPEKYGKYVYSNKFGFSVPKSNIGIENGAYDCTLALSEGDNHFRICDECESFMINKEYIYRSWKPWKDVRVQTWIIPFTPWHLRVHRITTQRPLESCEGGFSFARELERITCSKEMIEYNENGVIAAPPWCASGMFDLNNKRVAKIIMPEANTNLLYSRTLLPVLLGRHNPGDFVLSSLVLGGENQDAHNSTRPRVGILLEQDRIKINICQNDLNKEYRFDIN
jgi:hypothetical protein